MFILVNMCIIHRHGELQTNPWDAKCGICDKMLLILIIWDLKIRKKRSFSTCFTNTFMRRMHKQELTWKKEARMNLNGRMKNGENGD